MANILIVDDDASVSGALRQVFEYDSHHVAVAPNGAAGLERLASDNPDVVFLDVKMPGMDGLDVLTRMRKLDSRTPVIMISGHGNIDTAVEATRRGAYDFLEKPLDTARLFVTLRNALDMNGLKRSVESLQTEVESRYEIVGSSYQVRQMLMRIEKVAPTRARVLITGENGTGKELVARAVHRLSDRRNRPFVEVNCAAIPSELIESELFGHMKGSFTGAVADHAGKFEQADGGILFLDEIGDMSFAAQAKVLRVLEQGMVVRVGGSRSVRVDVRVIAATNKDLALEISNDRFREDLYYRLNVVPIEVAPLRARREDIPMLVKHFTTLMVRTGRASRKHFTEGALRRLKRMDWPGNVRQLRNAVERFLILAEGDQIRAEDVRLLSAGRPAAAAEELFASASFADFKDRAERAFIVHKLREHDWNIAETARAVHMPRSNLYKKIHKFGLERES
jgi:two-component system nitrogen regulation response regulator NtrX